METIDRILPKVLTAMQARTTMEQPKPTIIQRYKRRAQFETLKEPQLDSFLNAAAQFAASINFTRPYWLTLSSHSGTGKTMLARAVYRQFMDQNRFERRVIENRIVGTQAGFSTGANFATACA